MAPQAIANLAALIFGLVSLFMWAVAAITGEPRDAVRAFAFGVLSCAAWYLGVITA